VRGTVGRETTSKKYSESHVRSILRACDIKIVSDTSHDFLCFCPIHNNRNTPSLSVSKTKDSFLCFNADCGVSGTLVELVQKTTGRTYFEAARFVLNNQPSVEDEFQEDLEQLLSSADEFREFSPEVLKRLQSGMYGKNPGREYLSGRGFSDETIEYFQVGYSPRKNMVAVPVHSPTGIPVGVVGRSINDKRFKNSVGLPTSRTFFNLHRAKRFSSTVVITEASFDAMAVHQSGFTNSVGNLGGHFSPEKAYLIDRHFDSIVLFLDNPKIDESGKMLAEKIANMFARRKEVLWANDGDGWYTGGLKDASAILEQHGEAAVARCIANAIPHWQYVSSVV
jgi:DNA primase